MSSDTAHKGSESENPVIDAPEPKSDAPLRNQDWWPNQVDVSRLHPQVAEANPLGEDFDYAEEFAKLNVDALKADLIQYNREDVEALAGVARRMEALW